MQSVLCDSGYTGEPFALGVREALGDEVTVQIAKRSEVHKFAVDSQALGDRAQFCLAGEEQEAMEELRAFSQYQPAVCALGVLGAGTQEIVNTFSENGTICHEKLVL